MCTDSDSDDEDTHYSRLSLFSEGTDPAQVLRNSKGTLPHLATECLDLDSIVVDVGCNAGVGGSLWCQAAEKKYGSFERETSPTSFTFGAGGPVATDEVVIVPFVLGNCMAKMRMHIVPGPLPPLMSRPTMKALGMMINTKDDCCTGEIEGHAFLSPLTLSSSGHYLLRMVAPSVALP
jgi:hypothetical protein